MVRELLEEGRVFHIVDQGVETVHHGADAKDMDQDGDMDIVTAEMHTSSGTTYGNDDEVKVYLNPGTGTGLWPKFIVAMSGSHNIQVEDIDQDSDYDIIGANYNGNDIEMWKNTLIP